jgi:UDP-N-acetylglucosamine 1-carboxyvinyltransferase
MFGNVSNFLNQFKDRQYFPASLMHNRIEVPAIGTGQIFIETAPHPGYPTDLQPQSAPIMAKFLGGTINERIWQNRFLYLSALSPFGIGFEQEGQSAFIKPSTLRCACSYAPDLRGGAAAVITALGTRGHSKIKNAEIIFRGYSDIGNKLRNLGAKIDVI